MPKEITLKNFGFRKPAFFEPDWLYELRCQGWQLQNELPPPSRTEHIWRYTSPEHFAISDVLAAMKRLPSAASGTGPKADLDPQLAGYGYNQSDLVAYALLQPSLAASGVVFEDLVTAVAQDKGLLRQYLGKIVSPDFGVFEAANMALWNTGLFLYVPDGMVVDQPFYLRRHPAGAATITRLLVVAGKGSRFAVIDDYNCHCYHASELVNNVVELFVEDDAWLDYVHIERLGPGANIYSTIRKRLGRQAVGQMTFASLGGKVTKINAGTILAGQGAESRMFGVAVADGRQHFDHHTFHHHAAPKTTSDIDFKVVLKDRSVSAYTGLIRIEADAPDCEAYQENRNLLLDDGAKAESIPELEILNDQVRCTHGATVGPLDPEILFYLRSRGYDESEAIRTIVSGFVEPLMHKIPARVGELVRDLVQAKLESEGREDS